MENVHCSHHISPMVRVSQENKIFDLTLPTLITFVPRSKKVKKVKKNSFIGKKKVKRVKKKFGFVQVRPDTPRPINACRYMKKLKLLKLEVSNQRFCSPGTPYQWYLEYIPENAFRVLSPPQEAFESGLSIEILNGKSRLQSLRKASLVEIHSQRYYEPRPLHCKKQILFQGALQALYYICSNVQTKYHLETQYFTFLKIVVNYL